jgi:anthranilate synthase/aminodeoxychorismate synthase-like glutamine amidotransferase
MKKILLIDNFDSFTFNLVDFFEISGAEVSVLRNDVPIEKIHPEHFHLLVLSPGPSIPKNAGNLLQIIEKSLSCIPIFGVCLGHEALAEYFGGSLTFVPPVHGKHSPILHDGKTIFQNIPKNFLAGRYHSLAVNTMPKDFEVSAQTEDGVIMAMRHRSLPIESVQFHPESVLTMKKGNGMKLIKNVMEILSK